MRPVTHSTSRVCRASCTARCSPTFRASASTNRRHGCGKTTSVAAARFWTHYFAKLQTLFPQALAGADACGMHRGINVISPSENRVAADAATYDLHILVRYELELALLAGDSNVAELPGAWNERYGHYLGVTPRSPREGCLQDVHWALGEFGYFPTYTIGNLYAAQLIEAYAREADLAAEVVVGNFNSLRDWLARKVYAHGALLDAEDLIEAATGQRLNAEPFFARLALRVAELD